MDFLCELKYIFLWMVKYTENNIGRHSGIAQNRRQTIIRINDDLVYWRMYASRYCPQ